MPVALPGASSESERVGQEAAIGTVVLPKPRVNPEALVPPHVVRDDRARAGRCRHLERNLLMSDLIPPHGGLSEPVNRTVETPRSQRIGGRGGSPGEGSGIRRGPVHGLPVRRRRAEPFGRADGSGDVRARARRGGHRPRGQALRVDDSAFASGHGGTGQNDYAGTARGTGARRRQRRGYARRHRMSSPGTSAST